MADLWKPPTSGFEHITSSRLVDEELNEAYDASNWYPVKFGEVFHERYQVRAKLGWGGSSTVWLAKDLSAKDSKQDGWVTLKVYAGGMEADEEGEMGKSREFAFYDAVNEYKQQEHLDTGSDGELSICNCLGRFVISWDNPGGPPGSKPTTQTHQVVVLEPLGWTIHTLFLSFLKKTELIPESLSKDILRSTLLALDFMHTKIKRIHADVDEQNLMLTLSDRADLDEFAEREDAQPCARKIIDSTRTVYEARELREPKEYLAPMLCDFGHSTHIKEDHACMGLAGKPHARSPQMMFDVKWTEKLDIWQFGCMAWYLFEGERLFKLPNHPSSDASVYDAHLEQMISLLGHPSVELLHHPDAEDAKVWFENFCQGISPRTLEDREGRLLSEPAKREIFLDFMHKCVQWKEQDRWSAKQLLGHPWLLEK
ncbi:kinase-like protein [Rhizodiscina lignyota]|uniref:non-specific serine/threonine protein kinase n=1 Tax=Rhizodiscina lignyota TaxID=1504668 RepID=A0A9P4IEG8_9PEZI|nr:kinase-like protein [Rhizodiscina lignyota]